MPSSNCFVLPQGISLSNAAMLEPLSVVMHVVKQVNQIAGKSVLITVGGPIGQLILRVAHAFGAYKTNVSVVIQYAREFALKSGAYDVVDPLDENAFKALHGYDIVFEASGVPSALSNGI